MPLFHLSMEMSRLTRAGTVEPVSRDQILRHERGQGNIRFSCSVDHVQDWQPYPVDLYSCYVCDHTISYLPITCSTTHSIETRNNPAQPDFFSSSGKPHFVYFALKKDLFWSPKNAFARVCVTIRAFDSFIMVPTTLNRL